MTSQPSTSTVHVNGIDLFYEVAGAGEPLSLLHGGHGPVFLDAALQFAETSLTFLRDAT
jgi:hypothetical protein